MGMPDKAEPPSDAPVVIVVGPTGSGKSGLALQLAARFSGEIINCDSVQVYRNFDIGTAKMPIDERAGIPHHLLDVVGPEHNYTAGEFQRQGRALLADITARHRLPIVAGGTGFYLRALLQGLAPGPPQETDIRDKLTQREQRRPGSLHRLLRRWDAASAARIHPHDAHKLVRAVQVYLQNRQSLSTLHALGREPLQGYRVLKIGLAPPRALLQAHLEQRVRAMFAAGLVEETRALLTAGVPRHAKPFGSLGYAQALCVLDGTLSVENAIAETHLRTRQYAKRQTTWFRRESGVAWLLGFGDESYVMEQALSLVAQHLEARAA